MKLDVFPHNPAYDVVDLGSGHGEHSRELLSGLALRKQAPHLQNLLGGQLSYPAAARVDGGGDQLKVPRIHTFSTLACVVELETGRNGSDVFLIKCLVGNHKHGLSSNFPTRLTISPLVVYGSLPDPTAGDGINNVIWTNPEVVIREKPGMIAHKLPTAACAALEHSDRTTTPTLADAGRVQVWAGEYFGHGPIVAYNNMSYPRRPE